MLIELLVSGLIVNRRRIYLYQRCWTDAVARFFHPPARADQGQHSRRRLSVIGVPAAFQQPSDRG